MAGEAETEMLTKVEKRMAATKPLAISRTGKSLVSTARTRLNKGALSIDSILRLHSSAQTAVYRTRIARRYLERTVKEVSRCE